MLWPHVAANETAAGVQAKHLLWALHFLKLYVPVRANAAMIGCDAKTHTKWVWIVLDILADVDNNVSTLVCRVLQVVSVNAVFYGQKRILRSREQALY
jgi:hypothetical protein